MKRHLSSEQISRWIAGEGTAEEQRHVEECPECRAELSRLQYALSSFRDSVRECSAQWQGEWQPIAAPALNRMHWVRWCMAAAALVLMAAVPIQKSRLDRQREAELARADALLMERVDAAVSRTVPAPMEPLMRLISIEGEVR